MSKMQRLDELSLTNKVIFAALCAALVGENVRTKLKCTQKQSEALINVLKASKLFREELDCRTATVASIVEKLRVKHEAALMFENMFNVPWPL
jgi:hypothetical protein